MAIRGARRWRYGVVRQDREKVLAQMAVWNGYKAGYGEAMAEVLKALREPGVGEERGARLEEILSAYVRIVLVEWLEREGDERKAPPALLDYMKFIRALDVRMGKGDGVLDAQEKEVWQAGQAALLRLRGHSV